MSNLMWVITELSGLDHVQGIFTSSNWTMPEIARGSGCVKVVTDGFFDVDCSTRRPFICQIIPGGVPDLTYIMSGVVRYDWFGVVLSSVCVCVCAIRIQPIEVVFIFCSFCMNSDYTMLDLSSIQFEYVSI